MNNIPFDNSYVRLSETFYSKTVPTPVKEPTLFKKNLALSSVLGLEDLLIESDATEVFSGNKLLKGSEPISMAYSGHQFGGFSPQLGDGRAILLGEIVGKDGVRYDIQLKGSGRTPWSRGGDGRSALGPVIREYLLSEAMFALGVPTTRALAAVTTGEQVARQKMTPGGILTRVATGFVRVGTFQYFSSQGNVEGLKELADYEIERHYPNARLTKAPYAALLEEIVDAQAKLIAKWMSLGFIHGVMNTDNMSISGETIDYGPCAFMDDFSHSRVYSSIDTQGRYAYQNQPQIAQWNLVRLAEALLPLFEEYALPEQGKKEDVVVHIAQEILNEYQGLYKGYWLAEMRQKLGLTSDGSEQQNANDHALVSALLDIMQTAKADFTLTFYYLSKGDQSRDALNSLFRQSEVSEADVGFDAWLQEYQARLKEDRLSEVESLNVMRSVNPLYIPRNHQVEAAIRAGEDNEDFSKFNELHQLLQNPFEYQEGMGEYMLPPTPEEVVHQTFCGT